MTYKQLVHFFGSEAEAARALKMHRQTVNKWKRRIPLDQQIDIEVATKGALRADIPEAVRGSVTASNAL